MTWKDKGGGYNQGAPARVGDDSARVRAMCQMSKEGFKGRNDRSGLLMYLGLAGLRGEQDRIRTVLAELAV